MYEIEMVNKVCDYLRDKGIAAVTEVPFMQQSIDLFYLENNQLIAMEFKIDNWKRAIEQASSHFLGTNEVYICIPKPKKGMPEKLSEAMAKTDVGLVFFDEASDNIMEVVYPAKHNKKVWKIGKIWLNEAFENRVHGVWA